MRNISSHPCVASSAVFVAALALAACGDDGYKVGRVGAIDLHPSALEFVLDRVAPHATVTESFMLANLGDGPLTIHALSLEPDAASAELPTVVAIADTPTPFIVPPGATAPITLAYTRSDDHVRSFDLVIESSDPAHRLLTAPVGVTSGEPLLLATPRRLDFEAPATLSVRLLNTGSGDLHVTGARVDGDAVFAAMVGTQNIAAGAPTTSLDASIVVPAGGETAISVTFSATDRRPFQGTLVLFADSTNALNGFPIPLTGYANLPCIAVNPPRLAFGSKPEASVTEMPVAIRNCGTAPLVIDGVRLTDANDATDSALATLGAIVATSPRFELVETTLPDASQPVVLATNEEHAFHVRYTAGDAPALANPTEVVPPDLGVLVVHSNALLPYVAVGLSAATEGVYTPPPPPVVDHAGCSWRGGAVTSHHVVVTMTADDHYAAWLAGDELATDLGDWRDLDTYETDLDSGCYVLGVHVWDSGGNISGLLATIEIDGVIRWRSGDNQPEWAVTGPVQPPGDWLALDYDETEWLTPRACFDDHAWGGMPYALRAAGANWIWWNKACTDLTNAWFRLTFTVD